MTPLQKFLADKRRLADAATPGPWWHVPDGPVTLPSGRTYMNGGEVRYGDPNDTSEQYDLLDAFHDYDYKFIAASRTLIPLLLDIIERQHGALVEVSKLGKMTLLCDPADYDFNAEDAYEAGATNAFCDAADTARAAIRDVEGLL